MVAVLDDSTSEYAPDYVRSQRELTAVLPRQAAVVPSTGREVPEMPLTGNFPPTWWYGYDGLFCSAWDETTKIIYCNSEFRL